MAGSHQESTRKSQVTWRAFTNGSRVGFTKRNRSIRSSLQSSRLSCVAAALCTMPRRERKAPIRHWESPAKGNPQSSLPRTGNHRPINYRSILNWGCKSRKTGNNRQTRRVPLWDSGEVTMESIGKLVLSQQVGPRSGKRLSSKETLRLN